MQKKRVAVSIFFVGQSIGIHAHTHTHAEESHEIDSAKRNHAGLHGIDRAIPIRRNQFALPSNARVEKMNISHNSDVAHKQTKYSLLHIGCRMIAVDMRGKTSPTNDRSIFVARTIHGVFSRFLGIFLRLPVTVDPLCLHHRGRNTVAAFTYKPSPKRTPSHQDKHSHTTVLGEETTKTTTNNNNNRHPVYFFTFFFCCCYSFGSCPYTHTHTF